MELIKGKLRKVLNKVLKMSSYDMKNGSSGTLPVNVKNVRMYVDNDRWAIYKYKFEVDIEVIVPTYVGGPTTFKYANDAYIKKLLRRRMSFQSQDIEKKCNMFTGHDGNTQVQYKKISIIRNNTPPSLENS
jgi:hypothetical protein